MGCDKVKNWSSVPLVVFPPIHHPTLMPFQTSRGNEPNCCNPLQCGLVEKKTPGTFSHSLRSLRVPQKEVEGLLTFKFNMATWPFL